MPVVDFGPCGCCDCCTGSNFLSSIGWEVDIDRPYCFYRFPGTDTAATYSGSGIAAMPAPSPFSLGGGVDGWASSVSVVLSSQFTLNISQQCYDGYAEVRASVLVATEYRGISCGTVIDLMLGVTQTYLPSAWCANDYTLDLSDILSNPPDDGGPCVCPVSSGSIRIYRP